jgi:hypothetical protein
MKLWFPIAPVSIPYRPLWEVIGSEWGVLEFSRPRSFRGLQQGFQTGPRNRPVVMKPVWATIRWSGRTL